MPKAQIQWVWSLRLEEQEYDILFADGLIGKELHTNLKQELAAKRLRVEARPALDLAVQKAELVRQFPLFSGMDDKQRERLAGSLKARYVQPGEVLMRKGETPREVCFIASGAVEVETAGQKSRLGRGDMFGQLSLLSRQTRRTQVTAISHSTLLVLDEAEAVWKRCPVVSFHKAVGGRDGTFHRWHRPGTGHAFP